MSRNRERPIPSQTRSLGIGLSLILNLNGHWPGYWWFSPRRFENQKNGHFLFCSISLQIPTTTSTWHVEKIERKCFSLPLILMIYESPWVWPLGAIACLPDKTIRILRLYTLKLAKKSESLGMFEASDLGLTSDVYYLKQNFHTFPVNVVLILFVHLKLNRQQQKYIAEAKFSCLHDHVQFGDRSLKAAKSFQFPAYFCLPISFEPNFAYG